MMTEQDKSNQKPEETQDIVYYYSRENRLERASPAVRELNESGRSRTGLGKAIAGNRGNLLILGSILAICFMYFIGTRFSGSSGSEFILGGNTVSAAILEEEGVLFFSLQKITPSGASSYTGAVDIGVSPVQQSGAGEASSMSHRVFFTLDSPETYLVSLPFEGDSFIVMLRTEYETVTATINKSP